jgi:hypothetical protein
MENSTRGPNGESKSLPDEIEPGWCDWCGLDLEQPISDTECCMHYKVEDDSTKYK